MWKSRPDLQQMRDIAQHAANLRKCQWVATGPGIGLVNGVQSSLHQQPRSSQENRECCSCLYLDGRGGYK
jgi:hypothetical protein